MSTTYSMAAPSFLSSHFRVHADADLVQFTPSNTHNLSEVLLAKIKSIIHYFQTGVWVDTRVLCDFATQHPDQRISSLFQGRKLQHKLIRYEHSLVVPKPSLLEMFMNGLKFLLQFIKHPSTVGAILPSSSNLAHEICSLIPKDPQAKKRLILEVGPGTGTFTDKIISKLNPSDELHLVEFDEQFCKDLQERYKHIPNVKIFCRSFTDHTSPTGEPYDYIVSGLPLNAFKAPFVETVFRKFTEISHAKSTLSYFEYLFLPDISRTFASSQDKTNVDKILGIKKRFYEQHSLRTADVFLNCPPARVVHHTL